jgi:hypothetical protein
MALRVSFSRATAELDASRAAAVPAGLELTVDHLQAGLEFEVGRGALRGFAGVSAGVGRFRPSSGGAEPGFAFAVGGGVGAWWQPIQRLRLRLEVRGFGSRLDPEGGSFCVDTEAGVCGVRNPERLLLQSQVALGVSVVF